MRSQQENPREEVRNDAIRDRNVKGQGLKIGNNERGRGREGEREERTTEQSAGEAGGGGRRSVVLDF